MGFHELFNVVFIVYEHFPPPLAIALSVVSMERLSPHKMAEIRPGTKQQGVPRSENVRQVPRVTDTEGTFDWPVSDSVAVPGIF